MAHEVPDSYTWYMVAPGDTDKRVFVWKVDGTPQNITGYSAQLVIDHSGKRTVIAIPSGQIDAPAGRITAIIDNSVSEDFTTREGKFRVTVTAPDGEPKTIVYGPLVVATL